jgi:ABC-type nitrate/sulfonate/bicarbonate transport system substrate-binding protein
MPETLTLLRSKADITPATPELRYAISADLPTVSALANHLGLLDVELADELDLDVIFSRRDTPAAANPWQGDGYGIRDAELPAAQRDRAAGGDSRLVALAFLDVSSPVVTLTSSGIRSVADLRGKRLGIATTEDGFRDLGYAQQLKVYTTALSSAGLTLHDVRFVPFEADKSDPAAIRTKDEKIKAALGVGKDIAQRLLRHEFDAIVVDAAADVAHHASIRVLYDTVEHPDYLARAHPDSLRGIVVSGALLRERRDLVVRVLARLLQAADWAKAHPKVTASALAGSFAGNFDDLTGRYKNLSEGLQINLGVEKVLSLKAQKIFLLRHRLISRDFDIDSWIDHGPLVEAHLLYAEWKKSGRVREPLRRS